MVRANSLLTQYLPLAENYIYGANSEIELKFTQIVTLKIYKPVYYQQMPCQHLNCTKYIHIVSLVIIIEL